MEKKEPIKISLPLFITIIVLLVAIISGVYVYMQNQKLDKEIDRLKEQISKTQTEKNELQEKLNKITDVASNTDTDNSTENNTASNNNNTSVSFTDEQVKTALANYLELQAHAGVCALFENLTEKGKLNYNPSKDSFQSNGEVITTVKFADYKNAMLNYVSENEFEKNWNTTQYIKANSDGYLYRLEGGGGLRVYTIKSITKTNNTSYTAKVSSVVDNNEYYEEDTLNFTIKDYNGHCVIDSINKI
ncbi:MAG: hypothetical protein IKF83_01070 [Clostridia bacterium]|nr:hypothetical protein [Clostridia bacterium]